MADARAEQRFRELYDRHYAQILAYCLRRSEASDGAEAAAQTFVVAWRRLDDVPGGDDALPWLYGVARRALANQRRGLRRHRKLVERLTALPVEISPDVESLVVRRAEHQEVLEALALLRPRDQEILRLAAWEELSRPAIADLLGCSRQAVDQRFHRAMRRFAKQYRARAESIQASVGPSMSGERR